MFTGGVDDGDDEGWVRTEGWTFEAAGEDREGAIVRRFRSRQWCAKTWGLIEKDLQAERDRMYGRLRAQ